MSLHEVDFRYGWMSSTLHALQSGFESIRNKAQVESWFDGLWQLEHAEAIFGVAFVVAQAYMLGTVEDVNKIRQNSGRGEIDKVTYYFEDLQPIHNGISRILLINSIANYYKHHDEWDSWPTNLTGRTLADVNIVRSTEFPCYEAAKKLWDESDVENLDNLLLIITKWRRYVLAKYK